MKSITTKAGKLKTRSLPDKDSHLREGAPSKSVDQTDRHGGTWPYQMGHQTPTKCAILSPDFEKKTWIQCVMLKFRFCLHKIAHFSAINKWHRNWQHKFQGQFTENQQFGWWTPPWTLLEVKKFEKVNIKTIWNPFPGVYVILRTFLCNAHVTMAKQGQKTAKNGQTHACTILNASKPD